MNSYYIILATFIIGGFGFSEAQIPPGQNFFQSLPEEEREDFLVYCLGNIVLKNSSLPLSRNHDTRFPDALGIDTNLLRKFENLKTPDNFTTNLYDLVKSQYNMDQQSLRNLILLRMVCLSNGTCVDMSDVGSMCCPF